jgi:UDP-N-acetylmuramoyl-L-alanyl-D-glutamate--2,6-diaminopimelate ligase
MMPQERVEPGYPLARLLDGIAQIDLADDLTITGLSSRAQAVRSGDLFLALSGRRTHGVNYLSEALARGAAAVAWEPAAGIAPPASLDDIPLIAIDHLTPQVGVIADRFFGQPSRELSMIGVTGTDGKTSVSHFLAQALDEPGQRCGLIGTLGYGLYGRLEAGEHTTPDAVRLHAELARLRAQGAAAAVMEVSSHALDQYRVSGVAMDVAILTNLTRDHLDYHADAASYAGAKRRLFQMPGLRHAVVNADDPFGLELARSLDPTVNVLGYGTRPSPLSPDQMVQASDIGSTASGLRFRVRTPTSEGVVESTLLGRFNVSNLLATLAALLMLEMPLARALARLQRTCGAPGRMEAHGGGDRPLIVVDYAHTPAALAQVLIALREHCRGRLWCVFGCGGDRDRGKRPLMGQVVERHADEAIVTDDNPRTEPPAAIIAQILAGVSDHGDMHVIHDRAEAIGYAVSHAQPGDIVLVAGKGHEQMQITGTEQRPFSDSLVVAQLLDGRMQ